MSTHFNGTSQQLEAAPRIENIDRPLKDLFCSDLGCSVRLYNILIENGYQTLRDVTKVTALDLLHHKGFGRVTLNELRTLFASLGLSIREDPFIDIRAEERARIREWAERMRQTQMGRSNLGPLHGVGMQDGWRAALTELLDFLKEPE